LPVEPADDAELPALLALPAEFSDPPALVPESELPLEHANAARPNASTDHAERITAFKEKSKPERTVLAIVRSVDPRRR
jgi:hypothetical protein